MSVKLEGLAETIKALEAIGVNLDKPKLREMVRNESQVIVNMAKNYAPYKTGGLRDSIGFVIDKDKQYKNTVLITARVAYRNSRGLANFFEGGTNQRVQKKTGRYTGFVGPVRFMQRAFDENRQRVGEAINGNIQKEIAELAKKNNIATK